MLPYYECIRFWGLREDRIGFFLSTDRSIFFCAVGFVQHVRFVRDAGAGEHRIPRRAGRLRVVHGSGRRRGDHRHRLGLPHRLHDALHAHGARRRARLHLRHELLGLRQRRDVSNVGHPVVRVTFSIRNDRRHFAPPPSPLRDSISIFRTRIWLLILWCEYNKIMW